MWAHPFGVSMGGSLVNIFCGGFGGGVARISSPGPVQEVLDPSIGEIFGDT